MTWVRYTCRCFFSLVRLPQVLGFCGQYRCWTLMFMIILPSPAVNLLKAVQNALIHRFSGGRCFLGIYSLGPPGAYTSMMMSRRRTALTPKVWSANSRSIGSRNHSRLFVMANQPLRSPLGDAMSACLPCYCGLCTSSIFCFRKTSQTRCPPCCCSPWGFVFSCPFVL